MILSFELTMPNVGSWDGKWTSASKPHFRFRKMSKEEAEKILQGEPHRSFYYNFGDGWGANVRVQPMASAEKNRLEKINAGFSGYDWMIDSIIKHDEIIIKKENTK